MEGDKTKALEEKVRILEEEVKVLKEEMSSLKETMSLTFEERLPRGMRENFFKVVVRNFEKDEGFSDGHKWRFTFDESGQVNCLICKEYDGSTLIAKRFYNEVTRENFSSLIFYRDCGVGRREKVKVILRPSDEASGDIYINSELPIYGKKARWKRVASWRYAPRNLES